MCWRPTHSGCELGGHHSKASTYESYIYIYIYMGMCCGTGTPKPVSFGSPGAPNPRAARPPLLGAALGLLEVAVPHVGARLQHQRARLGRATTHMGHANQKGAVVWRSLKGVLQGRVEGGLGGGGEGFRGLQAKLTTPIAICTRKN